MEQQYTSEELDLMAGITAMHAAIHLFRKQDIEPHYVLVLLEHFIDTKEIGICPKKRVPKKRRKKNGQGETPIRPEEV